MTDRGFTYPNFGHEARVEVRGREVRLIFVASTEDRANDMADLLLHQLKSGAVNLTMMGRPTSVTESALPDHDG